MLLPPLLLLMLLLPLLLLMLLQPLLLLMLLLPLLLLLMLLLPLLVAGSTSIPSPIYHPLHASRRRQRRPGTTSPLRQLPASCHPLPVTPLSRLLRVGLPWIGLGLVSGEPVPQLPPPTPTPPGQAAARRSALDRVRVSVRRARSPVATPYPYPPWPGGCASVCPRCCAPTAVPTAVPTAAPTARCSRPPPAFARAGAYAYHLHPAQAG